MRKCIVHYYEVNGEGHGYTFEHIKENDLNIWKLGHGFSNNLPNNSQINWN